MIWGSGEPWEVERLKWKSPHGSSWHPYFAWFPVKVANNRWAWLQIVERQYLQGMTYWPPYYRLPPK